VGAVIAIVIGAVLVAGGIGFAVYWFVFKKKKDN
jgi:flagellar basal body-associated protein FliL